MALSFRFITNSKAMKMTAIKKLSALLLAAIFGGMVACDSNNSTSSDYHGNDAEVDTSMNQTDTRTGMSDEEGTNALDEGSMPATGESGIMSGQSGSGAGTTSDTLR